MKAKIIFALVVVLAVVAGHFVFSRLRPPPAGAEPPPPVDALAGAGDTAPQAAPRATAPALRWSAAPARGSLPAEPLPEETAPATNKAERLEQVRQTFRLLAAGDPRTALAAARQTTNATERETALLALVTEWTHGELGPPRQRGQAIAQYGLEAGLGFELAGNPELAALWAAELTEGSGQAALLGRAAVTMVSSQPAAALALGDQLAGPQRQEFQDAVFAGWAQKDTESALEWAQSLADPAAQAAALQAIRTVAPVGIGAELRTEDGNMVVNRLLPGSAAELGGQIKPGDRILAVAQGDNSFIDARNLALKDVVQMIRGAPGSVVQLQVLPADAPSDSQPRTVSIVRGQLKFKQ